MTSRLSGWRGPPSTVIEPGTAAVLSEGAAALVGDSIRPDQVESIEQMVEAAVALRDCAPYIAAPSYVSLDLIDE
ncbi:hypothetical protein ACFRFQ_08075 [Rhodococcus sp. NPDC056743]|uniref:hypothetical protein n=1 Tax=Rhodococcus sp. NPDC056743 TaxID=3345934 RepID=UPI00366F3B1D